MADILICHTGKSTGVSDSIRRGYFAFSCASLMVRGVWCMLAYCHGLQGHVDGAEPSLMLLGKQRQSQHSFAKRFFPNT